MYFLSQTNGLQHFPTVPTRSFICQMEKLLDAYLAPKMYRERNAGITTNPRKIADYLSTVDRPSDENKLAIFAYRDKNLLNHLHFLPSNPQPL